MEILQYHFNRTKVTKLTEIVIINSHNKNCAFSKKCNKIKCKCKLSLQSKTCGINMGNA